MIELSELANSESDYDVAKEIITNSILETYEGCSKIVDKKIYVNLRVGGEECQIAISLTAPKTPVDIGVSSLDTAKMRMTAEEYESLGKEVEDMFKILNIK